MEFPHHAKFLYIISSFANEFIQDLDFFQQLNKPVFPFVELRLQQLTSYIKMYRNSNDFEPFLKNLIIQHRFNTNESCSIFQVAFETAYKKFTAHIPNHTARPHFYAYKVFDTKYI